MIDVRHLHYFLAVARARHFSRAADDLGVSQPSLSRQIKMLEKRLGTDLFERSSQGVFLTPAGEFLAERAPALLNELDALERDVRAVGEGSSGVLRLGFVGTATFQLMPKLLARIHAELPNVDARVSGEKLTPDLERLLLTRQLDAVVLRPPVSSPEIELESFGEDDFTLAVGPDHPLLGRHGAIPFSALADYPIVAFQQGSAAELIVRRAADDAGFELHIAQHAPETSTVLSLVAAGMGVALVPRGSIPRPMGKLQMLEISGGPTIGLAMAWVRGNTSPLLRRIKPLLADTAAQSRHAKHHRGNDAASQEG